MRTESPKSGFEEREYERYDGRKKKQILAKTKVEKEKSRIKMSRDWQCSLPPKKLYAIFNFLNWFS